MGLSSGTLIHQTEFSSLKDIIEGKSFRVSYCVEEFEYRIITSAKSHSGTTYIHVFPMVSFSEIPINSLQFHLYRYGDCLIGMKKDWGLKNKLNPVHYCNYESNLTESLIAVYHTYNLLGYIDTHEKDVKTTGSVHDEMINDTLQHLEYQIAHTKNYRGSVKTKRYEDNDYYFSEEKEWRFVPLPTDEMPRLSLHIDNFNKHKEKYQTEIGEIKLNFNFSDISYIIVNDETQRDEIIKILARDGAHFHTNVFTNQEVKQNFFGYKNASIEEYEIKVERHSLLKKLEEMKK